VWVKLIVGEAFAPEAGEKPRRDEGHSNPAALHCYCRFSGERPSNGWDTVCTMRDTPKPVSCYVINPASCYLYA
jgi:hypothetical protein